jgi:hypothetical protein
VSTWATHFLPPDVSPAPGADADSVEPVDQIGDAGYAGEAGKVVRGRRLVRLAQALLDPDLSAPTVRARDAKAGLVRAQPRVDVTVGLVWPPVASRRKRLDALDPWSKAADKPDCWAVFLPRVAAKIRISAFPADASCNRLTGGFDARVANPTRRGRSFSRDVTRHRFRIIPR